VDFEDFTGMNISVSSPVRDDPFWRGMSELLKPRTFEAYRIRTNGAE
jgi:hypothetical protein